jgi:hypothetical protein
VENVKLLSNSEVKLWRRCRRAWYLGYYRQLGLKARDPYGSASSIGNLVHDALAAYYDPATRTDPVAFAQAKIKDALEKDPGLSADITKEADLVVVMLEGYMEWLEETGADSDITITGSEQMARVKLIDGVDLIAKLDATVDRYRDGAKLALEHKTTDNFSRPLSVLKLDTQFLTEHLVRFLGMLEAGASADDAQEACHGVLWNGMRKVKRTAKATPPFYLRIDVTHNIHELRNHWRHVVAVAIEIQEATEKLDMGVDHHGVCPPNPTKDCSWDCDHFHVCVMFDDGSQVEHALEALYVVRDPLERYDGATLLEV